MEPFEWKSVHERVAFKQAFSVQSNVFISLNSFTMADMSTDWSEMPECWICITLTAKEYQIHGLKRIHFTIWLFKLFCLLDVSSVCRGCSYFVYVRFVYDMLNFIMCILRAIYIDIYGYEAILVVSTFQCFTVWHIICTCKTRKKNCHSSKSCWQLFGSVLPWAFEHWEHTHTHNFNVISEYIYVYLDLLCETRVHPLTISLVFP